MIEIINYKEDFNNEPLINRIAGFLETILEDFEKNSYEVNLVLCGNDFIQSLNSQYRGIDSPTDVLSFSFEEGESLDDEASDEEDGFSGESLALGDIIISIDKTEEQSKEFGIPFIEEFARLAIHGMLHLLGFDHERSEEDEKTMLKKQDEYVDKFLTKYS